MWPHLFQRPPLRVPQGQETCRLGGHLGGLGWGVTSLAWAPDPVAASDQTQTVQSCWRCLNMLGHMLLLQLVYSVLCLTDIKEHSVLSIQYQKCWINASLNSNQAHFPIFSLIFNLSLVRSVHWWLSLVVSCSYYVTICGLAHQFPVHVLLQEKATHSLSIHIHISCIEVMWLLLTLWGNLISYYWCKSESFFLLLELRIW